jgi:molybdopterin/thiamine biosynthesis adenylyltransferase
MNDRYSRNRIYVSPEEQHIIKNYPILLAGNGIGSNIAECALRFGFENITLIDGDIIDISNLNRQNYTDQEVSMYKAESLYNRLKNINPEASIRYINEFITKENLDRILENVSVAFNALDFTSTIPVLFDRACQEKKITVLHPYNLGWAGLVTTITPDSQNLETLGDENSMNELNVVIFASQYLKKTGQNVDWLDKIIMSYKEEEELLPPPQLAIGSWLVAGICTTLLYKIATGKSFRQFPEFYFSSIME